MVIGAGLLNPASLRMGEYEMVFSAGYYCWD